MPSEEEAPEHGATAVVVDQWPPSRREALPVSARDANSSAQAGPLTPGVPRGEVGPLTSFVQSGGNFPVLMLAHARVELLRKSLDSLASVRGFSKKRLFVAMDGDARNVTDLLRGRGIAYETHMQAPITGPRWKVGATRIARHYKWSLNKVFRSFDPKAPGVLIVEDDLLFSPDFLEYFLAAAPLLDQDASLWLVSAWNDNGFAHLVQGAKRLQRSDFLPGLGWLMPREQWERELEPKWPEQHWDHWMRKPEQHSGREVIFPQLPRVLHVGVEGTFMTRETHRRYFQKVVAAGDGAATWAVTRAGGPVLADTQVAHAKSQAYEEELEEAFRKAEVPQNLGDLARAVDRTSKVVALWIRVDPDKSLGFEPIASFFGIWHEARRGAHHGLHELWFGETRVLLANVHPKFGKASKWRTDFQCVDSDCDAHGEYPCCSVGGWCGNTKQHCECQGCVDYRKLLQLHSSYSNPKPTAAPVFVADDFRGLKALPHSGPPRKLHLLEGAV